MDVLHRCCAGLDVHKRTVVACVRRVDPAGKVSKSIETFATMTTSLLALSDWLAAQGVRVVAMKSTGSYWKPVFNLLESRFEVILVNAHHIKQVPGRKPDVKDSASSRHPLSGRHDCMQVLKKVANLIRAVDHRR